MTREDECFCTEEHRQRWKWHQDGCPKSYFESPSEVPRFPVGRIRLQDPTTNGDALGYICGLARFDANGGELDLIEKCERYLRAMLPSSTGEEMKR
jgi:hypothetical protein